MGRDLGDVKGLGLWSEDKKIEVDENENKKEMVRAEQSCWQTHMWCYPSHAGKVLELIRN